LKGDSRRKYPVQAVVDVGLPNDVAGLLVSPGVV
jgi:hypothetical protein